MDSKYQARKIESAYAVTGDGSEPRFIEPSNDLPNRNSIEVLRIVRDLQQQHGLRHGDYQRYRGYCTRRVKRLRRAVNLPQGGKRHFKKRDITQSNLSNTSLADRVIQIPLMLSERAWSYAMQLRQESNTESRKKFHMISRLRKACWYSSQFYQLCNTEHFDARTLLQAEAYAAGMHGTLHFELSLWKTAAENLKKAQIIYEKLASALPEEDQGVYKFKIDELTPSLRYCAYNIDDGASIDDLLELRAQGLLENLDVLVSQTNSQSLQTIEWRGRKITVRPEKVRLFLLSLHELDKSLQRAKNDDAKIEILENIIMDCKDAIYAVKDEIKQDPKLKVSSGAHVASGVQYLLAYLHYIRLTKTLQRNLCLVAQTKAKLIDPNENSKVLDGKKVRPQDLTRLYEIILVNISEMQQNSGLEKDSSYQHDMQDLITTFKAFRCYYIALTLVEMKLWKESVAMYERSKKYATEALTAKFDEFNLLDDKKKLILAIDGCKFSAHAYSVLENEIVEDPISTLYSQKQLKPLFERITKYKEDMSLNGKNPDVYKVTPDMQSIPCKPLFFDLAFNYVELPSLSLKVENSGVKKAGISGFVKGILGWGGRK